jgi:putative ABC transport system ATP-binding protein
MKRPEPVPADEPAGKLDRAAAMQVMGPIARIDREEGTTFPISAQDAASAAFRRRRVLVGEARVTGRGGAAADRRPEA